MGKKSKKKEKKEKKELKKIQVACKKAKKNKKKTRKALRKELQAVMEKLKPLREAYRTAKKKQKKVCKKFSEAKKVESPRKNKVKSKISVIVKDPKNISKTIAAKPKPTKSAKPKEAKSTTQKVETEELTEITATANKMPVAENSKAEKILNKAGAPRKIMAKDTTPPTKKPAAARRPSRPDNLKRIEGIGPKIEQLLHNAGIVTFADLAVTTIARLEEILEAAGARYRMHKPTTWSQQSMMCRDEKWEELKKWQEELKGGR